MKKNLRLKQNMLQLRVKCLFFEKFMKTVKEHSKSIEKLFQTEFR